MHSPSSPARVLAALCSASGGICKPNRPLGLPLTSLDILALSPPLPSSPVPSSPIISPAPTFSETSCSSSSSLPSTGTSPKRPRCLRSLALAALVEDMADVNAAAGRISHAADLDLPCPDNILEAAALPTAAIVCTAVLVARLDASGVLVTWENLSSLLVGCLVVGSEAVGRDTAGNVADAAQIEVDEVKAHSELVRQCLKDGDRQISVAVFREFEELLDGVMPVECL